MAHRSYEDSLSGCIISIVGKHRLHNSLLSDYIEKKTYAKCSINISFLNCISEKDTLSEKKIILADALSYPVDTFIEFLAKGYCKSKISFVVFNVYSGFKVEKLIKYGVVGAFYEYQDPDLLIKGLFEIQKGELWFPRNVLNRHIVSLQQKRDNMESNQRAALTDREFEVLMSIVAGNTNRRIAHELCISPHTVKTHVTNILRKINAPNRAAAVNWAREQIELSHSAMI